MKRKRPRRQTRKGRRESGPPIDKEQLRRAARLARSFIPRGKLGENLRRLSDRRAIVDVFMLVGAAAQKVYRTPWNELTLKTLSILLARIGDDEVLRRSITAWAAAEKLGGAKRQRLREEVARGLRDDAGRSTKPHNDRR